MIESVRTRFRRTGFSPRHKVSGLSWVRHLTVGVVSALLCMSCEWYNPAAPSEIAESVLTLSASAMEIPADGFSVVTLEAEITEEAAEERRDVTFVTTRGTFAGGDELGGRRLSRKVTTTGVAGVDLVSSTRVGTARVTAEVFGGVVSELSIRFVAIDEWAVLGWSASRTVLPADGVSRTTLTAIVDVRVPGSQRMVAVRATHGELVGGRRDEGGSTIVLAPNARGLARVELVSSRTVGTARVTAEITLRDAAGNERRVVRGMTICFASLAVGGGGC